MGFIRAGFTGGFLGIVVSIVDIFVNSIWLERLSSVGLYVANFFGKVCINANECTLAEKFTTIIATIVGNCIAYFVIFALFSLALSVIKMWFTSSRQESVQIQQPVQQPPQIIVQQPVQPQQVEQPQAEAKPQKEKRPKKKARVRKTR